MAEELCNDGISWEKLEPRLRTMTRMLVRRHRTRIDRVADALIAKTTLSGEELDRLVGRSVVGSGRYEIGDRLDGNFSLSVAPRVEPDRLPHGDHGPMGACAPKLALLLILEVLVFGLVIVHRHSHCSMKIREPFLARSIPVPRLRADELSGGVYRVLGSPAPALLNVLAFPLVSDPARSLFISGHVFSHGFDHVGLEQVDGFGHWRTPTTFQAKQAIGE
jgi:hypothetical protein